MYFGISALLKVLIMDYEGLKQRDSKLMPVCFCYYHKLLFRKINIFLLTFHNFFQPLISRQSRSNNFNLESTLVRGLARCRFDEHKVFAK